MKKFTITDEQKKTIKIAAITTGSVVVTGVGLYFLNRSNFGETVKRCLAERLLDSMVVRNRNKAVVTFSFSNSIPAELRSEFEILVRDWMAKLP